MMMVGLVHWEGTNVTPMQLLTLKRRSGALQSMSLDVSYLFFTSIVTSYHHMYVILNVLTGP